ncbi:MAG TPA: SRPBCC family protein [Stellaceae bacterium]|nr:SRPBCC family protein [Stellaceae bacterium]
MEATMAHTNEVKTGIKPEPLVISRTFPVPREQVFKAWSSAEHLKRWFSPEGYTVPEAEIDFRPGGVCAICMRSSEGQDFWSRGKYLEIAPPQRLVFTSAIAVGGSQKFTAHTTVTFEAEGAGTRMTVRQIYEVFDADFLAAVAGAAEGWRTTLDKLEQEVARIAGGDGGPVVHASFSLERTFEAAPAQVFHAFSDSAAKARWFGSGEGLTILERSMDVRPGGREHLKGRWTSGTTSTFDAIYFDVVPNRHLVYAYEMHLDDRKISVSLATVELSAAGAGTRLVITEQGAFLDGYDDGGSRERGTGFLLDRLGASLQG